MTAPLTLPKGYQGGLRVLPAAYLAAMSDIVFDFVAGRGFIPAPFVFSRASGAALFSSGALTSYGSNTPRFASNGLLLEGSRTNQNPNARGEGGSPPSTYPTGWGYAFTPPSSIAFVTVGNVPCIALTFTPTGSGSCNFRFATSTVSVVSGAAYTNSFMWGFTAPPPAQITQVGGFNVGESDWSVAIGSIPTNGSLSLVSHAYTASTTASGNHGFRVVWSAACSFTILLGAPQFEAGAFASTPMLPDVGSPSTVTRARESLTAALAALSLPATARGTYLFSGVIPALGADMALVDLHDGSTNNRLTLAALANGSIAPKRVLGGSSAVGDSSRTVTANANFRAGLSLFGDGSVRVYASGGSEQSVTGGPNSGLNTISLSGAFSGESPFARLWAARGIRTPLSGAALANAVNAMPLAA